MAEKRPPNAQEAAFISIVLGDAALRIPGTETAMLAEAGKTKWQADENGVAKFKCAIMVGIYLVNSRRGLRQFDLHLVKFTGEPVCSLGSFSLEVVDPTFYVTHFETVHQPLERGRYSIAVLLDGVVKNWAAVLVE